MPDTKSPTEISLYTFVTNTPPPVVRLLVELAPVFAVARWAAEVSSWRSARTSESWLAVFVWWAACLTARTAFKYLLPLVIISPLALRYASQRLPFLQKRLSKSSTVPPATEATVSAALADVQTLEGLLPQLPAISDFPLPPLAIARVLLILYLPYLLVTKFVPASIIIATTGTIVLTWRSPWLTTSRRILLSSGWARYVIGRSWTILSGLPSPSMNFLVPPSPSVSLTKANKSSLSGVDMSQLPEPALLRFTFSVMENQRWWMGLDWTAALLPSDRPSWSSVPPALSPLPPPGSMSLPGPVTVYLPLPSGPSGYRMKRMSKWKWEDTEWKVVVGKAGTDGEVYTERVKMDLPMDAEGLGAGSAARLVDAVGKGLRRGQSVNVDNGSPNRENGRAAAGHEKEPPSVGNAVTGDTELGLTDADGWMYADNKWSPLPRRVASGSIPARAGGPGSPYLKRRSMSSQASQ